MSAISTAIADGKTTQSEKLAVDSAYLTYKSAFGSYSTALENANKAIQQKLDSLSTDKVNAIEVGGKNLILNTTSSNTQVTLSSGVAYHFFFGLTPISNFGLKAGDSVVLAFNLDGVPAGYYCGAAFAVEVNGSVIYAQGAATYQSGQRAVYVYKLPVGTTQIAPYIALNTVAVGSISFDYNSLKLEKGNKATDWSPAPKDTQKVLDDMSSDNKLTAQEKSVALKEWQAIQGEYTRLSTLATQLGVSNTLSTPYTNLANYINPLLSSMTVTSDIVGSTFRSYFTAYYNASTDLQNALTSKVQANVTNLKPAGKNYLIGSRTDSLVGWIADGGTMSVVTDPQFGKVVEYSRPAGGGNWMKAFQIDVSELKNTELVYYCIAKPISGTTVFNFGGWQETFTMLNNNSPYRNLGIDGWRLYYKVFTSGSTIQSGDVFGLNSVGGTWRFHSFGVAKGNTPPADWDASPKEIDFLKQGYQASTDIEGGVVQTAILLLRNLAEQVTAGMSGLGDDNIGMWAGGTYQEALNSIAKIILRKDGSGQLAGGNISWGVDGNLLVKGAIEALSGKIAGLTISEGAMMSDTITISDAPVETLAGLAGTPFTLNLARQASWTAIQSATGGVFATATSQNFTLASDANIVLRAYTAGTGTYKTGALEIRRASDDSLVWRPFAPTTELHDLNYSTGLSAGTYYIYVQSYAYQSGGGTATARAYISGLAANPDVIQVTGLISKTRIGNDGFFSFWNANKYLYFSEQFGISVRGATDIPAGLGGASINSAGVVSAPWGKITGTDKVIKSGSNYTITHNIGDTNYSIILTPKSTNIPYFLDTNRLANTIVVTCAGGFDFVLIRTK
jgi:hypothetical protein